MEARNTIILGNYQCGGACLVSSPFTSRLSADTEKPGIGLDTQRKSHFARHPQERLTRSLLEDSIRKMIISMGKTVGRLACWNVTPTRLSFLRWFHTRWPHTRARPHTHGLENSTFR